MRHFVGRKAETGVIKRELVPGRLVALVGPSGMGKTTLARAYVSGTHSRFVECRNLTPTHVARELAELPDATEVEAWYVAAEALADVNVVVFDDIGPDFGALEAFRAHWPGAILTTSQHVVEGDNISIVPLNAFDVPPIEGIEDSVVKSSNTSTARSVDARFDVNADDLEAIHTIATRFGGYPLGIALAARRAAAVTASGVLMHLDQTDALSDRSRPERHQTIDKAISMSWNSLSMTQQARLYAMSLFERPVGVDVISKLVVEPLSETLNGIEVLVQEAFISPARFPVPRELFANHAIANFDGTGEQTAQAIRTRALELAANLAHDLPFGFSDDSVFGEGPSLWQWAVLQPEVETLEAEDVDAILAAYARWAKFTTHNGVDGFAEYLALLEQKGGWNAWLNRGRIGDLRWNLAVEAFEHSVSHASDAKQRLQTLLAASDLMSSQGNFELANEYMVRAENESLDHPMLEIVRAKVSPHARPRLYLRICEQIESMDQVDLTYLGLCFKAMSFAPVARLPEAGERGITAAKALRSPVWLGKTQLVYAECLGLHGVEFDKSFEYMEDAATVLTTLDPDRLDDSASMRAGMYLCAGRAREARHLIEDVITRRTNPSPSMHRLLMLAEWLDPSCETVTSFVPDGSYVSPFAKDIQALATAGYLFEDGQTDVASEIIKNADERLAPYFESLKLLMENQSAYEITDDLIQLRTQISQLLEPPRGSVGGGIVLLGFMTSRDLPALKRMDTLDALDHPVVIANDYSAVRLSRVWVAIASETSRRLLQALVEADAPIDFDPLAKLLYPDETLTYDALVNRVSVAVSRLRRIGLKPYVLKTPDGFVLEGDIRIEQL